MSLTCIKCQKNIESVYMLDDFINSLSGLLKNFSINLIDEDPSNYPDDLPLSKRVCGDCLKLELLALPIISDHIRSLNENNNNRTDSLNKVIQKNEIVIKEFETKNKELEKTIKDNEKKIGNSLENKVGEELLLESEKEIESEKSTVDDKIKKSDEMNDLRDALAEKVIECAQHQLLIEELNKIKQKSPELCLEKSTWQMNLAILNKIERFFVNKKSIPDEIEQFLSLKELETGIENKSRKLMETAAEELNLQVSIMLQNYCEGLQRKNGILDILQQDILSKIITSEIVFSKSEIEASLDIIHKKMTFLDQVSKDMKSYAEEFKVINEK